MERLQIRNVGGDVVYFRNFSGTPSQFNPKGERNFGIFLDPDYARELSNEGWYIRWTKPRNGEDPRPYLSIKVTYDQKRPPKIVLVTSKSKTRLSEDLVHILDIFDKSDIKNLIMKIRPNEWDESGKYGASAWLEDLYFEVLDSEPEEYADIPYEDEVPIR